MDRRPDRIAGRIRLLTMDGSTRRCLLIDVVGVVAVVAVEDDDKDELLLGLERRSENVTILAAPPCLLVEIIRIFLH